MRVALIGDVHGKRPGLESVLDHARAHGAESFWNVGDLVSYGPFANEVVDRVCAAGAVSIAGNYDLKTLGLGEGADGHVWPKTEEKRFAFAWAYRRLSRQNGDYLRDQPIRMRLNVDGRRILLVHDGPNRTEPSLRPDPQAERMVEMAGAAEADVIVFGHSHTPFALLVAGRWFIDTGSVGRSDDGDRRAVYAQLRSEADGIEVTRFWLAYDLKRAAAAARRRRLPCAFVDMLVQGRDLDTVLRGRQLAAARRLSEKLGFQDGHAQHVTSLALQLFDQLAPGHSLGQGERFWLECAGLLHDIGWAEGRQGHHGTSLRLIRESDELPFDDKGRLTIGCIARYHRRALPSLSHTAFAELKPQERETVSMLAGILRVCDGLDSNHLSLISGIRAEIADRRLLLWCRAVRPVEDERRSGLEKADLLAQVSRRQVEIRWVKDG